MTKRIRTRLNSRGGFSFAEMLMAILILLMVTAVLAAGIPTAASAYSKIVTSANAQVLLSTTMTRLRDELGTAKDITVNDAKNEIAYTSDNGSKSKIYIVGSDVSQKPGIYIHEYTDVIEDDTFNRLLVTTEASNKNLHTTCAFDYSGGVVTVTGLTVLNGDTTVTEIDTFEIRILTDRT
ncbi:MAG: hypothetical protein IJV00_07225 [Clostridia bacterium]|nr:hypothetical protein [Clostridia bacterium]